MVSTWRNHFRTLSNQWTLKANIPFNDKRGIFNNYEKQQNKHIDRNVPEANSACK